MPRRRSGRGALVGRGSICGLGGDHWSYSDCSAGSDRRLRAGCTFRRPADRQRARSASLAHERVRCRGVRVAGAQSLSRLRRTLPPSGSQSARPLEPDVRRARREAGWGAVRSVGSHVGRRDGQARGHEGPHVRSEPLRRDGDRRDTRSNPSGAPRPSDRSAPLPRHPGSEVPATSRRVPICT